MADSSSVAELGAGWFGSGLSPHALRRLAECCSDTVEYPAGAILMREGSATSPFGLITQGRIALRLFVPERGAVTILTVEPGDVIGWSALVPPFRATSTAVAVEPSTIIAFDLRKLRAALREDPALAATLYPRLLEAVSRRLTATRQQLLDLYGQDAERVPW
jgi:CRP/FNR family transcriptional regulator, cyclic AMP receptor protein